MLSFFNKELVGKDSKIFEKPFPAPLFMTGVQFIFQHVFARAVFASGLAVRCGDRRTWMDWSKSSERMYIL